MQLVKKKGTVAGPNLDNPRVHYVDVELSEYVVTRQLGDYMVAAAMWYKDRFPDAELPEWDVFVVIDQEFFRNGNRVFCVQAQHYIVYCMTKDGPTAFTIWDDMGEGEAIAHISVFPSEVYVAN